MNTERFGKRIANAKLQISFDCVESKSLVELHKPDEVIAISKNWSKFYSVTGARCVIEVAITGVDTVMAIVVENHDIARKRVFCINLHAKFGLLVNRVW